MIRLENNCFIVRSRMVSFFSTEVNCTPWSLSFCSSWLLSTSVTSAVRIDPRKCFKIVANSTWDIHPRSELLLDQWYQLQLWKLGAQWVGSLSRRVFGTLPLSVFLFCQWMHNHSYCLTVLLTSGQWNLCLTQSDILVVLDVRP